MPKDALASDVHISFLCANLPNVQTKFEYDSLKIRTSRTSESMVIMKKKEKCNIIFIKSLLLRRCNGTWMLCDT